MASLRTNYLGLELQSPLIVFQLYPDGASGRY